MDLIIKNGTVVTPSGMYKADVGVQDGKIVEIAASIPAEAKEVVDAAGKLVLPGAIDGHTHLAMPFGGTISSEPGQLPAAVRPLCLTLPCKISVSPWWILSSAGTPCVRRMRQWTTGFMWQ